MNIKVQLDGVKVYNDAKVLTGVKIRSGGVRGLNRLQIGIGSRL